MKKNSKGKWMVLAGVLVILLVAAGIVYAQHSKNNPSIEQKEMEESLLEETSQPPSTEQPEGTETSEAVLTPEPINTPEPVVKKVIAIDAGHQGKGNSEHEPIGPGATKTKPKVSSGTQGTKTRIPEYQVNLEVALKLEKILLDYGYEVIMIRTTHEVNIPNSERAAIANESNADAFIRIHCNGSEDSSVAGALTMCQTKNNSFCGVELYEPSRKLAEKVLEEMCAATGAKNQGNIETDTMSGINWCEVPVTIVEMGFMTNAAEDELLSSEAYQEKLALGIAQGINKYFEE